MVKKVIFVCFRGAIAPITPTWILACITGALHTEFKQTVLNSWYTKTMGVSRGVKAVICPSLEIGTKNQNLLENLTSAAQFRLVDLFLVMTVYQPARQLTLHNRTRARLTVLVSRSGERAVHSRPLLCLQGQVAKLGSGLFYKWSLLCNNNMATNLLMFTSSYDIRHCLAHVTVECKHLCRQCSETMTADGLSRDAESAVALPPDLSKEAQLGQR